MVFSLGVLIRLGSRNLDVMVLLMLNLFNLGLAGQSFRLLFLKVKGLDFMIKDLFFTVWPGP